MVNLQEPSVLDRETTPMDFSTTWLEVLKNIWTHGNQVAPRGYQTWEVLGNQIVVDMRLPVLTVRERRLSYQFAAAEAYWILSGDDSVAGIAPWNDTISKFSDDGAKFFGAYGPRITDQLAYVVDILVRDPGSRQAGLTIWRENPCVTKDVPCTVAVFFSLREARLHAHVFMRSSDAWLGLPYDVFNFSMLAHLVCCRLNASNLPRAMEVTPGRLHLTMASSHLYVRDLERVELCLAPGVSFVDQAQTPGTLYRNEYYLMDLLKTLRDSKPGDGERWWEESHGASF